MPSQRISEKTTNIANPNVTCAGVMRSEGVSQNPPVEPLNRQAGEGAGEVNKSIEMIGKENKQAEVASGEGVEGQDLSRGAKDKVAINEGPTVEDSQGASSDMEVDHMYMQTMES